MPLSLTEFNHFYIINNAGYDFIRITRVLCGYGKG